MALNSTHIYLSWDHPPEDLHHGVIHYYQLNITEQETGRVFQQTSEETEITIGPLHPHYTYHCAVSAVTVDEGPYITITVRTHEDGRYNVCSIDSSFVIFFEFLPSCSPFWSSYKLPSDSRYLKITCSLMGPSPSTSPKWHCSDVHSHCSIKQQHPNN